MFVYNVDGTNYTFESEIGQEEAEKKVRALNAAAAVTKKEPRYEGFFTEAGEGILSGVSKIFEGVASTGTLVSDAITGGNATQVVEDWFDNMREQAGIDPEGAAGTVTEAIVQFGIPGIGAASAVSKVGKAAKFIKDTGPTSLLKGFRKPLKDIERRRRIREGGVKIGEKRVGEKAARDIEGGNVLRPDLQKPSKIKRTRDIETKGQKMGRYAVMATAAGLADAIVSTDDTQTLGDFFDAGPTNTIDAVGYEGRERAFAKILNKMKVGIEGGVATAVLPPAFLASLNAVNRTLAARPVELLESLGVPTVGKAIGNVLPTGKDTTVLDIASGFTVPATRKLFQFATDSILQREQDLLTRGLIGDQAVNTLPGIIGRMEAIARYRGFLTPDVARSRSLINPEVEGNIKLARQKMQEIDKKIKELLKNNEYVELPDQHKRKFIDNFMDVLEGAVRSTDRESGLSGTALERAADLERRIIDLPEPLYNLYREAKETIEKLTDDFTKTNIVQELPDVVPEGARGMISRSDFERQIRKIARQGGYLRRLYRIYNDKNFKLTDDAKNAIILKMVNGEGVDLQHVRGVLEPTSLRFSDTRANDLYARRANLTRDEAEKYIDEVTNKAKQSLGNRGIGLNRIFQTRLDVSLVQKRKVDSEVLKQILGEIRDPREAFISTVSELSNFIATDRFLAKFRDSVDANIAATAARNADRVARGLDEETPIFFKSDDEILKIVKNNSREFEDMGLGNIQQLDRITDLNSEVIEKAIQIFEKQNPNHIILGRAKDTVQGGGFAPGANATKSMFGSMFGYAIPRVMYNNLSISRYLDADTMPTFLRKVYGSMQTLKGATQYAKTILSPLTQIRNVTSAFGFALAQGNYGKGASLGTSVDTVLRDIIDRELKIKGRTFIDFVRDGDTLDFLVEMQRRGVIGSSAQLREIQENLRKGLGYDAKGDYVEGQVRGDPQIPGTVGGQGGERSPQFKTTARSKLGQFFDGPLSVAEDLYRGGDDIWKIYNYQFELNKYTNARRKMQSEAINQAKRTPGYKRSSGQDALTIIANATRIADERFARSIGAKAGTIGDDLTEATKVYAADSVRNLVPNYELVPDLIKGLRGMPVGNFIAFPAEILRTGFNTLDVAMKELSSDSAAIREIGSRRLINSLFAFGVMGEGLQRFGQMMTGTSDEEMDAINRRSAPWQKNALLIPVGTDKDGNPEVIDFSHTNPWDMLSKPFHTVLKSLREGAKLDKGAIQNARGAIYDAMGEFFQPFLDTSIIYDAFFDVLPREGITSFGVGRGGTTKSGAKVYKEADSLGVSVEKSLLHIANALKPGAVPIRIPTGADLGIMSDPVELKPGTPRAGEPVKSIELSRAARGILFPKGGEFFGFNVKAEEPTTGRDYTRAGEIFRAFTGLQTQLIDRDRILQFTGQEFKGKRSGAATLFSDALRLEDPTEAQVLQAYIRADDSRFKAFKEMKLAYDDFIKLGLKENQVIKILKTKAGLGNKELFALKTDQYVPYMPDKKKLLEAKRKGIDIPYNAILRIYKSRFKKRLTPEPERKESLPDAKNILNTAPVSTDLPPVSTNTQTQVPETTNLSEAVNTQLMTPDPRNREIASFLGGNPEQILKNMQIARRTG